MSSSRISSILRDAVILEEAFPFVSALFTLLGINTLGSFAGHSQEVIEQNAFNWEDT